MNSFTPEYEAKLRTTLAEGRMIDLNVIPVLLAEVERLRSENAALLGHDTADCPICRNALGLPEPANGHQEPGTAPVAANGAEMGESGGGQGDDALQAIIDRGWVACHGTHAPLEGIA